MATRCNILVTKTEHWSDVDGRPNPNNGKHFAQYYRHWDGYPHGAGLDLALKILQLTETKGPEDLKSVLDIENALRSLLTLDYEREHYRENSLHGDIEWLYHIDCDNGITLEAHALGIGQFDSDDWQKAPKQTLLRIRETDYCGRKVWQFVKLAVSA